jgi:hypothetical protein
MRANLPVVAPVLCVMLLLAACKPAPVADAGGGGAAPSPAADQASSDASAVAVSGDKPGPEPASAPTPPQLAMAYHYGLALPADQVRPMMESHQDACERAGTRQCQVLGASAEAQGRDDARAQLTLRATPAWVRMFRARAEADVKGAGGRVAEAGTTGEDLSQPIVDAGAAQRARAAEIGRLQGLMARRTKSLQDTLDVEKEITRVQGEMDQARSDMALMSNRVAMETVTVDYQSLAAVAPDGVSAPVQQASGAFVRNLMGAFAVIITLASYTLPFALIAAPLIWLLSRRAKKEAAPTV